jgi:hypothetical protein
MLISGVSRSEGFVPSFTAPADNQGHLIQIHTSVMRTLRSLRTRGLFPSPLAFAGRSAGFGGR